MRRNLTLEVSSDTDVSLDQEFSDDDVISTVSDLQCTCGVDVKAHKKHCPMNYRNHVPCRTVFPHSIPSSSAALWQEASSLECEVLETPPVKKARLGPTFNVGDGVFIHRKYFGKHHIACRIVRIVGKRYQLYCSEGVIKTLFSCGELTPFTKCRIPLDKWRQAPRIALKSSNCFEHCSCPLSETSISVTIILSSSEDENVGSDVWVRNNLYSLTCDSKKTITSISGWLTDEVISAAQLLILQYAPPGMSGLEPPVLQEGYRFTVHTGDFVQIINIENRHWCVVSTVGCDDGVDNVYDCLYSSLSEKTIYLIASLISSTSSKQKSGSWMLRTKQMVQIVVF